MTIIVLTCQKAEEIFFSSRVTDTLFFLNERHDFFMTYYSILLRGRSLDESRLRYPTCKLSAVLPIVLKLP